MDAIVAATCRRAPEAAPGRAAEHRAARGESEGPRRPPHRRSDPRPGRARPFPRFDDNARVLRDAYVSMAEDVHRGEFVTPAAEWLLDNYHLVASEVRDVRQNLPRGYYRELPKLAPREHAGDARVYAMAVELIRHSDSRLDRQQLRALPEQLPDRRPAHDRRAVGLAEHAQARPDREPAAPGGGGARRARCAAGRRRYVARIDDAGHGQPPPLPARPTPPSSCSCCSARASTGRACRRCAPRWRRTWPRSRRPPKTRSATSTSARRRRRSRWRTSSPACVCASTLDWSQYFESVSLVERVLQRDPAGAYGRMDFLSRDRYRQAVEELAERHRRGASCGWRCAPSRARARPPRADARHARRPRRLPPHRQGPRATSRPTSPIGPVSSGARGGFVFAHATAAYLGIDRARHRAAARRSAVALRPAARRLHLGPGLAAPRSCCCRRASWPCAFVQRLCRPLRAPAAPAPPRLPDRRAGERAHDGGRAHAADERRAASPSCSSTSRCWRSATSTRTSTSRSSSDFTDAPAARCRTTRRSWRPRAPASRR